MLQTFDKENAVSSINSEIKEKSLYVHKYFRLFVGHLFTSSKESLNSCIASCPVLLTSHRFLNSLIVPYTWIFILYFCLHFSFLSLFPFDLPIIEVTFRLRIFNVCTMY